MHNYYLIIGMKLIGGICAGVMWPMIAAFGMPVMIYLGNTFGWRNEFIILGVLMPHLDVATSVQSSTFNFAIMIASSVRGVALLNFSALSRMISLFLRMMRCKVS